MEKKVLVPVADGTEDLEAVGIIDVLRRADAEVTVASVGQLQIVGSRGIKMIADALISDCAGVKYDLVALPGGIPGADNLRDSTELDHYFKAPVYSGTTLWCHLCVTGHRSGAPRSSPGQKGHLSSGLYGPAFQYR